jgi:hypothetical protein
MQLNTTICALATGGGTSALAIIRVSGPEALSVTDKIFVGKKNKKLINQNGYTLHFGNIVWKNEIIDEVLVSVFKQPHSYTGEHLIEISCHGSIFIQQSILSNTHKIFPEAINIQHNFKMSNQVLFVFLKKKIRYPEIIIKGASINKASAKGQCIILKIIPIISIKFPAKYIIEFFDLRDLLL